MARQPPTRLVDATSVLMRVDALDVPFLPQVGQIFLVRTIIVQPADKHDTRPMVVVASPTDLLGRISLVTRTSQTESAHGIFHPKNRLVGLNKDGVFSRLSSTEAQLWTPRNVALLGPLEPAYLVAVIDRFWL